MITHGRLPCHTTPHRAEMAEDAAESLAEEAHSKATAMAALHAELLAALKVCGGRCVT